MFRQIGIGSRGNLVLAAILLLASQQLGLACGGGGVDVRIKVNGVDKTDETQDWIVGRRVALAVEVDGGTPTAQSWFIPGVPIKNYTASSTKAEVTHLSTEDRQQTNVYCYWYRGGADWEVRCTVTVGGVQYEGHTTFDVKRPTATLTTTTGSVSINDSSGHREMSFGLVGGTPGIAFWGSVTPPEGFSGGSTAYFQVYDTVLRRRQRSSDGVWERLTGGSVCDTWCPYPSMGLYADDTPGTVLQTTWSHKTLSDSASMYLMYKPSGTAIWVPLRKVVWSWWGSCHRTDELNNWSLDSSGHSADPSVNWTSEPIWAANLTSLLWFPE